jgi:hypothetical protein
MLLFKGSLSMLYQALEVTLEAQACALCESSSPTLLTRRLSELTPFYINV